MQRRCYGFCQYCSPSLSLVIQILCCFCCLLRLIGSPVMLNAAFQCQNMAGPVIDSTGQGTGGPKHLLRPRGIISRVLKGRQHPQHLQAPDFSDWLAGQAQSYISRRTNVVSPHP